MSEESEQKEVAAAKITARAQIFVAIISAMALVVVAIIGLRNRPLNSEITATLTSTFTPAPVITPTPYLCSYHGRTDNETVINLIEAEANASNTKDLSTILQIFDPNAIFHDFASNPTKEWIGPNARYEDDLFQNTEFQGVEHFDILPAGSGISGDTAYFTSGSKGSYRKSGSGWEIFFNGSLISTPSTKYGSEHWILKKNINGCWVIVQMEFNAGHIKFP